MARSPGLGERIHSDLQAVEGITEKAMCGGCAWLPDGNMLGGARDDGMIVRIGEDSDRWARRLRGRARMISRRRPRTGWVRVDEQAREDALLSKKLIDSAMSFVMILPGK